MFKDLRWSILFLLIFANPWIWTIFNQNPLVFLIVVVSSVLIFLLQTSYGNKKIITVAVILSFVVVSFIQIKTTQFRSLTILDNDEKRVYDQRIKFYNPSSHYLRVIFRRFNLGSFLEGDFRVATFRIQRNFFESLDPNVYFFAGHPRERVWASDFEKFPYIFVIPFTVGLYLIIKNRKKTVITWVVFAILTLSIIGHKNPLGPFILFPIFPAVIFSGIPKKFPGWLLTTGLILAIFVTVQTFLYAN